MNSKTILLLICILLCIAGAGCSTDDDAPTSSPLETPSSPSLPTATTAPLPETSPLPMEWNGDGIISEGEYLHSMTVGNGMMEIYWSSEADILFMALRSQYPGWAAVGFRPGSAMENADIIMGGSAEGQPYIFDMYATGRYGPHPPDTSLGGTFDVLEFRSVETTTGTTLEFSRPMNTGDEYDALLISGETIPLIWAVSDKDEPLFKHNKGKGRVDLRL